jgi:HTH-type transcriptional regulator/antitoxin HigA
LSRALERVNCLIDDYEPDSPQADELEVLSVLIHEYENRTVALPDASPAQVLAYVLEHRDLTASDLVPFVGSLDRVEAVLAGKRKLTIRMVRSLSEALHIPAGSLI